MATPTTDLTSKKVFKIISDTASEMGVRAFIVGGYVRDYYLGRDNNHIDIVVEGDAIELAKRIGGKSHTKVSVFKNFGQASFIFGGDNIVIHRARKERYKRGQQNQVSEAGTVYDDLLLRNFTIDAIAISLNQVDYGVLIDPLGGLKDLNQGIIRTIVQPQQTFQEDPLAMLRAIRLDIQLFPASVESRIEGTCMAAMRESANEVDSLARERVVEELNKMLLCDVPGDAIYLLDKVGILKRILPELAATKGVETVDKHGHEDTFPHTLSVLDNIAKLETSRSSETTNSLGIKQGEPNLWLRWTALLHDIGKPVSKRFVDGKGWTFYGYDVAGARMIPKVFSSLKLPLNEKLKYVQKLISLQNRPKMLIDTDSSESAFRRLLFDSSGDIEDLILLCEANITTRNKTKANQEFADMESVRQRLLEVQAKDAIRNFKNPISANYIMELYGLEPCNLLGTLKDYIKDAILSGEIGNNFEEADVLLRKKAAEMGLLTKEEKKKAEFNHSIVGTPSVESPLGSVHDVILPPKNEVVADDVRADAGENSELTLEQSTSPIDEPQNETQPSDVLDRGTLISQILHAMNDCGVVKLYFMATGEDLDEIQAKRSISKESIFLFTHDTSKDIQGKLVWALEVKLDALALPEAMVIWNGMPSKDLTIGTRIADLRILKDNSWDSNSPKESENLLSDYAFVIPKSLPVDYIINFESVYDEYSTILVF